MPVSLLETPMRPKSLQSDHKMLENNSDVHIDLNKNAGDLESKSQGFRSVSGITATTNASVPTASYIESCKVDKKI